MTAKVLLVAMRVKTYPLWNGARLPRYG